MLIIRLLRGRLAIGALIVAVLLAGLAPAGAQAQALPPGFVLDPVVTGLREPVSFDFTADGRIFIAERSGKVRVAQNGQLLEEPFVNIDHEVNDEGTRGLMGIAVHPNFPRVPYVYLAYVYEPLEAKKFDNAGARVSRLLRVEANPENTNVYRPDGFFVMLGANGTWDKVGNPNQGDEPPFTCQDENGEPVRDCLPAESLAHTIDFVRFGRDGALYVSNGDGTTNAKANIRAQDVDSLGGKILRINPITGRGYANNPFFDGDYDSNRSKVYALGLRNPFRFTMNPYGAGVVIGDVGNFTWEEINRGGAGANYGWPCYEGPDKAMDNSICDSLFSGARPVTSAVYQYTHDNGFGAVIGGDFYRGRRYPAPYRNAYFFADFNKGAIQYLTFAGGGASVHDFVPGSWGGIVQISSGPGGDLYLLSIAQGTLFRLRYVGDASPAPASGADAGSADEAASAPAQAQAQAAAPAQAASTEETGETAETALPAGQGTGKILREMWTDVGGKSIDDLFASPDYPDNPSARDYMTALEGPRDGKDFGVRIRGYIHPPVSGQYRFWIASDDASQLWLSTDANPANKVPIAGVHTWTPSRQWDKLPEQTSAIINLRAGQTYYIEIVHKQADQKTNLSVAWQPPGGGRTVIEGQYLSPFE